MNFASRARRATAIGVAVALGAAALSFAPLSATAAEASNASQSSAIVSKLNSSRVSAGLPKFKANGYIQRYVDQYTTNFAKGGRSYAEDHQTYGLPAGYGASNSLGYTLTRYTEKKAVTFLSSKYKSIATNSSYNFAAVGYYKKSKTTSYSFIIALNYASDPANLLTFNQPTIKGGVNYGNTLVAQTKSNPSSGVTYKYEWTANGSPVGANSYKIKISNSSLIGQKIAVKVTASKPGYTPVSKSSKSYTIYKGAFAAKKPVITGTKKVGKTVKTSASWAPPGITAKYKYQWLRNGKSISGATSYKYTLVKKDKKKKISVKITASADYFTTVTKTSSKKKVK